MNRMLLFILIVLPIVAKSDYWQLPVPLQGKAPETYPQLVKSLAPRSCAVCHPQQYADWQSSLHASAASKGLVGQLPAFDEASQDKCLTCHAPRSEQLLLWRSKGIAATDHLHGVDCATCHVRSHRRFSAQKNLDTPHGTVRQLRLFAEAQFCAPCHQFGADGESVNGKLLENTYEEWRASPYFSTEKTCQACHMPEKRHLFKGIHDPDMTRQGLKIEARRTHSGVALRAWNAGAGHALPTYATPQIRIVMQAVDNPNQRHEHIIQRRLMWDEEHGWKELFDTRLLPDKSTELSLGLDPKQQASITVQVKPDAYYREQVYPTLLRLIGDELNTEARNMLEQAYKTSGQTGYILYQLHCDSWTGQDSPCEI